MRARQKLHAEHKFEHVFHLAPTLARLESFHQAFQLHNNLLGSVNLINAAVNHNVRCSCFTSSIAVYGRNQVPMTEEAVPQPKTLWHRQYAVELD